METFGEMARRLRGDRSLREAARTAHIDPGHLSRVERDLRPPTPGIARALDDLYDAEGQLVTLAGLSPATRRLMSILGKPLELFS
ncbi:helix-turn-helix transcriptional regulator [Actinoplanes sp. NPDC049596]|uniref:helix-turn-helix domain-containing protein n=1 Tax=unclassified Actinoplanes TaxID=2626549 RepID=UPI0034319A47